MAPTGRNGNYTQISGKTIEISGTSQAVIAAGGTNKMGYQLLKKSKELKRDMEGILSQNWRGLRVLQAPRESAQVCRPMWQPTMYSSQVSGAQPAGTTTVGSETFYNGTTTRTYNGTQAAITEAQLKTVLQLIYKNSGESPEYGLVSPSNKQNISAFTGPGTRFIEVEDKVLMTAVDIYESDFGDVKLIPDIFLANSHDCFFVNPNYARVAYLRPFQTIPLAKIADADQKMLLCEYTLELGNEHAMGAIYDTTG